MVNLSAEKRQFFLVLHSTSMDTNLKMFYTRKSHRKDTFLLRTTECADRKRQIEKWWSTAKKIRPAFRKAVTLRKSMASEFLIADPTFCVGLSWMLVRLCLIMILNTFCFVMQFFLKINICFWNDRTTPMRTEVSPSLVDGLQELCRMMVVLCLIITNTSCFAVFLV